MVTMTRADRDRIGIRGDGGGMKSKELSLWMNGVRNLILESYNSYRRSIIIALNDCNKNYIPFGIVLRCHARTDHLTEGTRS